MNAEHLQAVSALLKDVSNAGTLLEVKEAILRYEAFEVPLVTAGIYSPWLYYLAPTLCPLINAPVKAALNSIGIGKLNYCDYVDLFEEIATILNETDLGMIDQVLWTSVGSGLSTLLKEAMDRYLQSKNEEAYGAAAVGAKAIKAIEKEINSLEILESKPRLSVKSSSGAGNWANIPWVALLDDRETSTVQQGVYPVFLFVQDMSGVYITLNQGVTLATESELIENKTKLRKLSAPLSEHGFKLDDRIDLRADRALGKKYEVSTIAYKLYSRDEIPDDIEIQSDIEALLAVYQDYVEKKGVQGEATLEQKSWIFQANPDIFDIDSAVKKLKSIRWVARQGASQMKAGSKVYFWRSGADAGIVAIGTMLTTPKEIPAMPDQFEFVREAGAFDSVEKRVELSIDEVLVTPLTRSQIKSDPVLSTLRIIKQPNGTNYPLEAGENERLMELLEGLRLSREEDLAKIVEHFNVSLRECGLNFGSRHNQVVTSFLLGLITKPFVILSGLSGSGKTQIALQLGNWFGSGRFIVVPVRPDWTGPESLLGFEDAFQSVSADGRRAWHVPSALQFILKAAQDSSNPYLLILDEMNLAHVERYFADFLSGIESRQGCIPNLEKGSDGCWRKRSHADDVIPIPSNLFVVGTVNVDETTYMFSPKVLDRANTFEFRVLTADLTARSGRPNPCRQASSDILAGFVAYTRGILQVESMPKNASDDFELMLRDVHVILAEHNFEFGHRTFYEATRFAQLFFFSGNSSPTAALDLQIMLKVLPRIHGSRRRLDQLLKQLGVFCRTLRRADSSEISLFSFDDSTTAPKLPIAFEKLRRMYRNLCANQFVSFTD